jgi:L-serine deaminase
MDWVNLFALAVNEENASGGRIVTAPTNGAAGIIPAVLHYYVRLSTTSELTCYPVGGLVQIPCIERNAIASVKAINAARLALNGTGSHTVSLDAAIRTMRETGRDIHVKYKETSRGGLAVNIVEC